MARLAATSRIAAHRSAIKLDFSISHDRNSVLILCKIVVAVFFVQGSRKENMKQSLLLAFALCSRRSYGTGCRDCEVIYYEFVCFQTKWPSSPLPPMLNRLRLETNYELVIWIPKDLQPKMFKKASRGSCQNETWRTPLCFLSFELLNHKKKEIITSLDSSLCVRVCVCLWNIDKENDHAWRVLVCLCVFCLNVNKKCKTKRGWKRKRFKFPRRKDSAEVVFLFSTNRALDHPRFPKGQPAQTHSRWASSWTTTANRFTKQQI